MDKETLIKDIMKNQKLVNRYLNQYDPDIWMGLSLTIAQVKSLFYIFNEGTTNFRQLAAAMKVTPSNVTGIIDRLVDQGLVSRTENPDDRRMLMLRLTEKGETLITHLRERRNSQMSAILSRMTEDELEAVLKGIAILAGVVDADKKG